MQVLLIETSDSSSISGTTLLTLKLEQHTVLARAILFFIKSKCRVGGEKARLRRETNWGEIRYEYVLTGTHNLFQFRIGGVVENPTRVLKHACTLKHIARDFRDTDACPRLN